jgi:hypothetical protein
MLLRPRRALLAPPTVGPVVTQGVAVYSAAAGVDSFTPVSWPSVLNADEYELSLDSSPLDVVDSNTLTYNVLTGSGGLGNATFEIQPRRNGSSWGPSSTLALNCFPGFAGFTWSKSSGLLLASAFTQGMPLSGNGDIYGDYTGIGVIGLARASDDLDSYLSGTANVLFDLTTWTNDHPACLLDSSTRTSLDIISGSGEACVFAVWYDATNDIYYASKPSSFVSYPS